MTTGTLLLDRADVTELLSETDYLEIVEGAFRAHAAGRTLRSCLLHVDASSGEFHIKAGGLAIDRPFFGLKVNGGFFGNVARWGMPAIQGVILLCDAENGYPLALMDSTRITLNRTGATTAVAARYLARPDSRRATIFGCGNQGRVQLSYLVHACPIEEAFAFDVDPVVAAEFASEMAPRLGLPVRAVTDPGAAVRRSDVCITCTPSRIPFLRSEDVPAGMFVAAVGADSPEKRELTAGLFETSVVVVDLLEQCVDVGELHHAVGEGTMTVDRVHAELGEIITGTRPGRTTEEEIIVFDATGTALQDTASAAAAYERALAMGFGRFFNFFTAA